MNKKEIWAGVTFLTLYTGFIFTGFSWMLSTKIKAEIAPIKENQARLESEIKIVKVELNNRMDRMETEQKDIKERIIRIESMLGQLIAQNTHHKGKIKPANKFKKPSKAKLSPPHAKPPASDQT